MRGGVRDGSIPGAFFYNYAINLCIAGTEPSWQVARGGVVSEYIDFSHSLHLVVNCNLSVLPMRGLQPRYVDSESVVSHKKVSMKKGRIQIWERWLA